MKSLELKGKTALVTGASNGLGADIARELAARGANLVLAARREDQLRRVAQELEQAHGVTARVAALDLAAPGAPQALFDQLQQDGVTVDVLVNNAGFGVYGDFVEMPWERVEAMLALNVTALTHLTRLFLPGMVRRGDGAVLQIASIAAYQSTPYYAAYAATKSYVLSLSEALNYELRGTGVSVTALAPGVTATDFFKVAGQQMNLYQRKMVMTSREVARIGVDSLARRRASVVAGGMNAFLAWGTRLVPRWFQTAMAAWMMKQ